MYRLREMVAYLMEQAMANKLKIINKKIVWKFIHWINERPSVGGCSNHIKNPRLIFPTLAHFTIVPLRAARRWVGNKHHNDGIFLFPLRRRLVYTIASPNRSGFFMLKLRRFIITVVIILFKANKRVRASSFWFLSWNSFQSNEKWRCECFVLCTWFSVELFYAGENWIVVAQQTKQETHTVIHFMFRVLKWCMRVGVRHWRPTIH